MNKKVCENTCNHSCQYRMFAITNEELSDPSTFIVPAVGQLNNWTWVGISENMGKKVCNASPNLLFNIFNKMNFDLAYFDGATWYWDSFTCNHLF